MAVNNCVEIQILSKNGLLLLQGQEASSKRTKVNFHVASMSEGNMIRGSGWFDSNFFLYLQYLFNACHFLMKLFKRAQREYPLMNAIDSQ